MTVIIIILIASFLLGIGGGAVAWFLLQQRKSAKSQPPPKETVKGGTLPFRWSYILAPLVILILSIIVTAYFFPQLPDEVGYHFNADGSPDRWFSQGAIIAWSVVPQLLLTMVAGAITWGITRLGILPKGAEGVWIKPERVLSLMGNMVALPQSVLIFAMLDIFSYNAYETHLILPVWIFALIIMLAGSIVLGIFFIQAIRGAWITSRDTTNNSLKERKP